MNNYMQEHKDMQEYLKNNKEMAINVLKENSSDNISDKEATLETLKLLRKKATLLKKIGYTKEIKKIEEEIKESRKR